MSIGSDSTLQAAIQGVKAVGTEWFTQAEAHHAQLTKPPGSLGLLESVGIQLSSIQETTSPVVKNTRVIVFAADHGITKHHEVGPYPREVTAQMVVNFIRGGAAINTFAGLNDADFTVVDMGVDADLSDFNISPSKNYVSAPVARGTADISAGPAMSTEQLSKALKTGLHLADECATRGIQAVALGEMGIGNTTIASAPHCDSCRWVYFNGGCVCGGECVSSCCGLCCLWAPFPRTWSPNPNECHEKKAVARSWFAFGRGYGSVFEFVVIKSGRWCHERYGNVCRSRC